MTSCLRRHRDPSLNPWAACVTAAAELRRLSAVASAGCRDAQIHAQRQEHCQKTSRLLSTQRPMRRRSRARLLALGGRCLGLLPALRRLQQLEVGRCARLLREDVVLQSTQRKGERLQPAHLHRQLKGRRALLASCPTCCKSVQRTPHDPRPTRSRDALLHNGLAEDGTKLAQLPQASRQASTDAQAKGFCQSKEPSTVAPGTPPCRRPCRPR